MSSRKDGRSQDDRGAEEAIRWLCRRLEADTLLDELRAKTDPQASGLGPETDAATQKSRTRLSPRLRARKGTAFSRPLPQS
jgi:hypothetical protein